MKCEYYEFGADTKVYSVTNKGQRKEVFFYARPITARRGFELGILALKKFHEMHPDYVINLAGWDVSEYDIPFPYVNHKALRISELSDLYNRCAAALVLSLTNMSLLPLELLAAGTIPVVNDAENNRLVSNNPYIKYAQPSPHALAQAMSDVVSKKDLPRYAEKASESVQNVGWEASGKKFVSVVEQELYG
jgi:glycosyltransferase involved in cell wall biosynthesis